MTRQAQLAGGRLRDGAKRALLALGNGFLSHPENRALRAALEGGSLTAAGYFQELLRLVYRVIFLLAAEERGALCSPAASSSAMAPYTENDGMRRLRDRAAEGVARHVALVQHGGAGGGLSELWEDVKIVFRGLAEGEPRLSLPALGGLFAEGPCPAFESARLENGVLLTAMLALGWLREDGGLAPVRFRELRPEELGSLHESLLELVPQITREPRAFVFATGGETRGNARKLAGSYYTPDSLVQVLLDMALEPVVQGAILANPESPAEALLRLSIVDPACGSGHFLLAAARRLASHVARLRAGSAPSAGDYREALTQVIERCLHGVDLDPMAVELCKASLWLEAASPGRPLSFLDSRIQHGNAVLGATPELLAGGVPHAAWEAIDGDDRKVAGALKRRNKEAAGSVRRGFPGPKSYLPGSESPLPGAESPPEERFLADAWCAAFVWPKQAGELAGAAPTDGVWREIRSGHAAPSPGMVKTTRELSERYRFFHWHLAFPEVLAKGGFDVVLSNPPWERVKLQQEEWFAERAPEIAEARNAAERKQRIQALKGRRPDLLSAFESEQREASGEAALLTRSGRFPLCGRGDVNTYSVFAELGCSLLARSGILGLVLPPGILTEDSNKAFARALVDTRRLRSFFAFTNRGHTFEQVESTMAFSLLSVGQEESDRIRLAGQLWNPGELGDPDRIHEIRASDVALFNPNTRGVPVFRSGRDMRIVRDLYERLPVLADEERRTSPWKVELGTMFHMAGASGHFRSRGDLEQRGFTLVGNRFTRGDEVYLPLYESKLAHQYNHRHATFEATEKDDGARFRRRARTGKPTAQHMRDPGWLPIPRYWLPADVVRRELSPGQSWILAYRRTINVVADARSVVASILPIAGVGDSLFLLRGLHASDACVVLAMLSSFVIDYVARQKASGGNLSFYVMKQLPVVPPEAIDGATRKLISDRVLELVVTANDLLPFAAECGHLGPPFQWDPGRRAVLRAELDAIFFHLFGIARADIEHVLGFFDVVRRREEAECGEYRTRRLILEAHEALAGKRG